MVADENASDTSMAFAFRQLSQPIGCKVDGISLKPYFELAAIHAHWFPETKKAVDEWCAASMDYWTK